MGADIAATKETRYIAVFEPTTQDNNGDNCRAVELASMMQQLEGVDQAAQRSASPEVKPAIEAP